MSTLYHAIYSSLHRTPAATISYLTEPTFAEVGPSPFAHLIEENELHLFVGVPRPAHAKICAHCEDPSPGIFASPGEVFWKTSLYVYKGSSSRHVIVVVVKENIGVVQTVI